jgi:hypothetical protein
VTSDGAQRLLCQRVSDTFPQRDGEKGGFDHCSQCGERVRVADTSREAVKIYAQVEIWCLDCCVKDPPPGGFEWEYGDAQIAEIARVTGRPPSEIVEQLAAVLPSLRKQGAKP